MHAMLVERRRCANFVYNGSLYTMLTLISRYVVTKANLPVGIVKIGRSAAHTLRRRKDKSALLCMKKSHALFSCCANCIVAPELLKMLIPGF